MKNYKFIFMSIIGLSVNIAQAEDNSVIALLQNSLNQGLNAVNSVLNKAADSECPGSTPSVASAIVVPVKQPVSLPVVSGITEKDGIIFYYKDPIFDLNSDDAHAAQVRGNLSDADYQDLVLKNGGAACSDEKIRKALLKMWAKDHKTILTTYEKVIGVTLFTTVVGCFMAYRYLYPPKEDKDSTEK